MAHAPYMLARYTARREGIVLVPYRDGAGWSVGCGRHLGKFETPPDIRVTINESFNNLLDDIEPRIAVVQKIIKVGILEHQRDALADLYYQGGTDGLTAVAKIINARNPSDPESVLTSDREAAIEFLKWDTAADGTHLSGLLMRRGRNVGMFTAGEYGSDLDEIPLWDRVNPETGKVLMKDMQLYKLKPKDLDLLKRPQKAKGP